MCSHMCLQTILQKAFPNFGILYYKQANRQKEVIPFPFQSWKTNPRGVPKKKGNLSSEITWIMWAQRKELMKSHYCDLCNCILRLQKESEKSELAWKVTVKSRWWVLCRGSAPRYVSRNPETEKLCLSSDPRKWQKCLGIWWLEHLTALW